MGPLIGFLFLMQGVEAGPTNTGRQEGRNPIGATSGGPLPQLTLNRVFIPDAGG